MIDVDVDPGLAFVALAFALDHHVPGYIDSCFVPSEQRDLKARTHCASLTEIAHTCDRLLARIEDDTGFDPVRRQYLSDQVQAMRRRVDLVGKPRRSVVDEARELLDIEPMWTAESDFEADHARVAHLLSSGSDPLAQRLQEFRAAGRVRLDDNSRLLFRILAGLRFRTADRFGVPPEDEVVLSIADELVARGYHRYLGGSRSQMEIRRAQVIDVPGLVSLVAHESYPGHHLELVHKEQYLVLGKGWLEHSLTVNEVPSCAISEGIACFGLTELMSEDEFVAWVAELMECEGQDAKEAARRVALQRIQLRLQSVHSNAAMLFDASPDDEDRVVGYIQHYGLTSVADAQRAVQFIRTVRSHVFSYQVGTALVERYLNASDDRRAGFIALLREPFTPGRLRSDLARTDAA